MKKTLAILCTMVLVMSLFAGVAGAADPTNIIKVYNDKGTQVDSVSDFDKVTTKGYMKKGYTLKVYEGTYSQPLTVTEDNFSIIGVGDAKEIILDATAAITLDPDVRYFTLENVTFQGPINLGTDGRYHKVTKCGITASGSLAIGAGSRDVTISQNEFGGSLNLFNGIGSGVKIINNNILALNLSNLNADGAEVDMSLNYWGDPAGPSVVGASYSTGAIIVADTTNLVLQPWLNNKLDKSPKPVFAVKNVTQDKYYWNLTDALDTVTGDLEAGDVINIGPFTFDEPAMSTNLSTSVTIVGVGNDRDEDDFSVLVEPIEIEAPGTPTEAVNVTLKNLILEFGATVTGNQEYAVTAVFDSIYAEDAGDASTIKIVSITDDKAVTVTVTKSTVETGTDDAINASGPATRIAVTHNTLKQTIEIAAQAVFLQNEARLTDFTGNTLKGKKDPERLSGSDRFDTAIKISDEFFYADLVVLARADNFADALAGAVFAGLNNAPILLTNTNNLPAPVLKQLGPLGLNASSVTILGGTGAVSGAVAGQLTNAGFVVERLAGSDRFATAVEIAKKTFPAPTKAVICRGDDFADALAAVTFAASAEVKAPILLVQQNSIPQVVLDYIADVQIEEFVIIGGAGAVSNAVMDELLDLDDTLSVNRLFGANRYATAVAVAEAVIDVLEIESAPVFLARGDDFADALAGGPLAIRDDSVILLTAPGSLSNDTKTLLDSADWRDVDVTILGGTGAVSEGVANQVSARNFKPIDTPTNP